MPKRFAPLVVATPFFDEPMPCYACDPAGYSTEMAPGPGYQVPLCAAHRSLEPLIVPPHLPPGWQASWRRGTWA